MDRQVIDQAEYAIPRERCANELIILIEMTAFRINIANVKCG
jgi:hypothetical protein